MVLTRDGSVVRLGNHVPVRHGGRPALRRCQDRDAEYTDEELAVLLWIDRKKREENNYRPDWPTVLRWFHELGYRREER